MKFSDFYGALTAVEKRSLATKLKTSVAYLSQLAHGHRLPGVRLLARIEWASGGRVTIKEMRPDIYPGPDDDIPVAKSGKGRRRKAL